MKVATYIATGFLDAGKTTLVNDILAQQGSRDMHILVLQFEQGEEELVLPHANIVARSFSAKRAELEPELVSDEIASLFSAMEQPFQEVWIEWNGMLPFSVLENIFLQPALKRTLRIDSILHVADAQRLENLLVATGGILQSQLAQSDFIILRNTADTRQLRSLKQLIRNSNPGVRIATQSDVRLLRQIFQTPLHPLTRAVLLGAIAVFFALALAPYLERSEEHTSEPSHT